MLVWLTLACGTSSDKLYAEDIVYQDGSVQDALIRLESRLSTNSLTGSTAPTLLELSVQVSNLEERMARVELETTTLKINGLMPAENVSYDPRATTLSARDLQTALDELTARVEAAEEKLSEEDMGQAGPGLFETQGRQGGPGGMGGQQGGMQQGGMGGQQGGMGGRQGGMGGPGGQQGGGMQGGMGGPGGQQGGGQQGGGQQGGPGGQQGGQQQGGR